MDPLSNLRPDFEASRCRDFGYVNSFKKFPNLRYRVPIFLATLPWATICTSLNYKNKTTNPEKQLKKRCFKATFTIIWFIVELLLESGSLALVGAGF